jgi:hypothetical protein
LFRPSLASLQSLTELETAMAAAEMKLLQPEDDAGHQVATPEPVQQPLAAAQTEHTPRAEGDADDFLFAPEKTAEEAAPPDAATGQSAPRAAGWEGGTFPDPALVTPKTLPSPQVEAEEPKTESRAAYDPLAPLRAMSDAEKIALFS